MSFVDIVVAFPIGIVYNILLFKITDIMYKECPYQEKLHKTAVTLFIFGLLGLIIAYKMIENRSIQLGLFGGSLLVIFYAVIQNWDSLDDITKLIIFIILFSGIIAWAYVRNKRNKRKAFKSKKNKHNNDNIANDNNANDNNDNNKKNTFSKLDEIKFIENNDGPYDYYFDES